MAGRALRQTRISIEVMTMSGSCSQLPRPRLHPLFGVLLILQSCQRLGAFKHNDRIRRSVRIRVASFEPQPKGVRVRELDGLAGLEKIGALGILQIELPEIATRARSPVEQVQVHFVVPGCGECFVIVDGPEGPRAVDGFTVAPQPLPCRTQIGGGAGIDLA